MKAYLFVVLAVMTLTLAGDARWPPSDRPSTHLALSSIHLYQATLAKLYARAGLRCRFTPTCSHYAEASVREWGLWRGGWLSVRRVLRCGPWTPADTADPPPAPARTAGGHRL